VHLAVGDVNEGRNRASKIEQRVQFDGSLSTAKRASLALEQNQSSCTQGQYSQVALGKGTLTLVLL
jgi:hypothetical protein